MKPFLVRGWPRAVIHIDGDGFFASCEQAVNPKLKGKPVVTGAERGIVSAASYEAKKLGISRAMSLSEIRKRFPQVVILPSDYETYGLFSERMYAILRRYTPEVEEYGIDECFGDITGMRRSLKMSYAEIAAAVKRDLEHELNMTFSVGLAPTKVLAKIGSKWQKPSGLTIIAGKDIHLYLTKLKAGNVWGIGPQTANFLHKQGVETALDFALKDYYWVKNKLSRPFVDIWHELRGVSTLVLDTENKEDYKSISKTRTFTPPSTDRSFIYSQLSKNVENACIKARRHSLAPQKIFFYLKTQEFKYHGYELVLPHPTALPNEILKLIEKYFELIYRPGVEYRATGIVLCELAAQAGTQFDLFGNVARSVEGRRIYATIDELAEKYGKHTVFLASSWKAMTERQHVGNRGYVPLRKRELFTGESSRRRIRLPYLGEVK